MNENMSLKQKKVTMKQSHDQNRRRIESQKRQHEEIKRKQREQEGINISYIPHNRKINLHC